MKKLLHDITYNNIKILDLKLKRINFFKERLLEKKPNILNYKKYEEWKKKLKEIEQEEAKIAEELRKAYLDLEKYL